MRTRLAGPLEALVHRVRAAVARRRPPAAARTLTAAPASSSAALARAREFRQPDQTSCGASALVFSRMVHDRAYAERLLADPSRWSREVEAMHRRVSRMRDHEGRAQWPWPRFVGTSPWAAARQMGGGSQRSGRGTRYGWRVLDPDNLEAELEQIATAVRAGHTVPLYVGNALRPAHVVLVVSADRGGLSAYEPSAGRIVRVAREAFVAGRFSLGGWSVPWFAVLPR